MPYSSALPGTLISMTVAAIVLAAGASRRLGQPKQLLLMDGETLLARVLRMANEAGAAPVFAVLGAYSERIGATLPAEIATSILNRNWETGLASSIHAGLLALEEHAPQASGVLILGCDQPRLTAEHLAALLRAFNEQNQPVIVASAYAGVLGIPAVFPRAVFAELLALNGDQGARRLLKQPTSPLISLPFVGGEVDIDVPVDLGELG
jgi:molybdenum cofactor cytidylyltransferase